LTAYANAACERPIGTIHKECQDWMILLSEGHLKRILRKFIRHYNRAVRIRLRGLGIQEPSQAEVPSGPHWHKLPIGYRVTSMPVLGGLHHEYGQEKEAA
jgi:putative transposase